MPNGALRVIAIMARKGGSGKTTLTRALASAAVVAGRRVALIDADCTGALGAWFRRSVDGGFGSPLMTFTDGRGVAAIEREIERIYDADRADLIFIDTAGVGADWSDSIAVLADHVVTPVMLSATDFRVGLQTATWFDALRDRVDDPDALPRHHVVLNMVPPRPTKADADLIARAVGCFPVIATVMLQRTAYKDMDRLGLLHAIALARQSDPNPLMKPHVRPLIEALEEATDILNDILAG